MKYFYSNETNIYIFAQINEVNMFYKTSRKFNNNNINKNK